MRISGELDRDSFDTKRNEIQLKINRIKVKITAHEKANNSFDDTVLGLLDIATEAGYVFDKSNNLELKRLLLKFVFESIILTKGKLSYKLNFPFNEFANSKVLQQTTTKVCELNKLEGNKGLQANDNEYLENGNIEICEPQILDKNQGVALKMQLLHRLVMLI